MVKYIDPTGRAPRAEYWYFIVFNMVAGTAAEIFDAVVFGRIANRAHGLDRHYRPVRPESQSKWRVLLLLFLPVISWIPLFVRACTRGTRRPNHFCFDPISGRLALVAPMPAT